MILSRTPFRITLGGGGTDLRSFYRKHGGFVLALGIDKYMYVAFNVPYADRKVRLHYTQSETVDDVRDLKHELAREALRMHGIHDAVEVASVADLPAGTGLGSSSSYLVGLLTAVRAYLSKPADPYEVAEEACGIELDVLAKPIGKQDQYMAAFAGLTELRIDRDGTVSVERISLPSYDIAEFLANTHLYYTRVQRSTTDILSDQKEALAAPASSVESSLLEIKDIGYAIASAFRKSDFDLFGRLMHDHWLAKQRLSPKVSVDGVDALYDYVRKHLGVTGGKIVGAGGGGFLMLYSPAQSRALTEFMASKGLSRLTYGAEFEGSRVVTNLLTSRSQHYHRPQGRPMIRTSPRSTREQGPI